MGVIKPHPEFWTTILELEKTDPSQAVFIDDNAPNVEGAKRLGIHSILFISPEKLIKDLSQWTSDSYS